MRCDQRMDVASFLDGCISCLSFFVYACRRGDQRGAIAAANFVILPVKKLARCGVQCSVSKKKLGEKL